MKIVVGIDGSEASSDALRYAHGEAVSSGAELVAVTAVSYTHLTLPTIYPV